MSPSLDATPELHIGAPSATLELRPDRGLPAVTVAALVAGLDTRAVTERLFISRHTVQDHLKSVFEKMSIHSRREMLAMFNASQDE